MTSNKSDNGYTGKSSHARVVEFMKTMAGESCGDGFPALSEFVEYGFMESINSVAIVRSFELLVNSGEIVLTGMTVTGGAKWVTDAIADEFLYSPKYNR